MNSADSHYLEPEDLWSSSLPKRLADLVPRSEKDPDGEWETVHVDGQSFRRKLPTGASNRHGDGMKPQGARDPKARLVDLDNEGVWAEVMFASLGMWNSSVRTPELLREDQYFPNEVASPNYPPASSGTNCSATGLDTDQYGGLVATATFFASAGDVNTNRVTYLAAASTIGLTDDCFLAFFIQSNVNASFGSNGFQSVISPFFSLKAGVWTRIYAKNFNSTGFVRNQLYILWPQDSAGATVKITKMIFCRNLTQQQARLLGREHPFNPLDKQGSRAVLNAAPTTGTWKVGDIVWNSAPASAGYLGWVCTVAGTPGTWKTWGLIS